MVFELVPIMLLKMGNKITLQNAVCDSIIVSGMNSGIELYFSFKIVLRSSCSFSSSIHIPGQPTHKNWIPSCIAISNKAVSQIPLVFSKIHFSEMGSLGL